MTLIQCRTAVLDAGPAFSRLLPIGPRTKGSPALRLNFNRSCMGSAGAGSKVFLSVRQFPTKIKVNCAFF